MKKNILRTVIALLAATMMVGCGSSNDEEDGPVTVTSPEDPTATPESPETPKTPATLALTDAEQQLVLGSNDFAFNLFREARDDEHSLVLSPLSITCDLGMLLNGATGETLEQILRTLCFESRDDVNNFCYKMKNLATILDEQTKVLMANTIFVNRDRGYELLQSFTSLAAAFYDADLQTRSFGDGKTLDAINQWASDHTEGMIEKVLSEEEFHPSSISYLLNALYFKGIWTTKFDKEQTKSEQFGSDGSEKEPTYKPMMHQKGPFFYSDDDNCQMLQMPYGNGSFLMTILLPSKGTNIGSVLQGLTQQRWQQMTRQMRPYPVDVKFPSFESSTNLNLVDVMMKLGMTNAFMQDKAEFPLFCTSPEPVFISLMKQVAKIKLDEEGTEASAVTVIGMADSAGPGSEVPEVKTFYADRPFLYVISEQSSGVIFFIGQYMGD